MPGSKISNLKDPPRPRTFPCFGNSRKVEPLHMRAAEEETEKLKTESGARVVLRWINPATTHPAHLSSFENSQNVK